MAAAPARCESDKAEDGTGDGGGEGVSTAVFRAAKRMVPNASEEFVNASVKDHKQ